MKIVENVYQIAESFMDDPRYVFMNHQRIDELAETIAKTEPQPFPFPDDGIETFNAIIRELVAASINYCYWYGKDTVRPNGSGSTNMYLLLDKAFANFKYSSDFEGCLDKFKRSLLINRYPLIEERIKHLDELNPYAIEIAIKIENRYAVGIDNAGVSMESLLEDIVTHLPGFASDIFLKRASLFFIQLYRRYGWFDDELADLHVPADYQVPKMLEHFGCTYYHNDLLKKIDRNELIPKNSLEECEIRAANILVVKRLCEKSLWNVSDIDSFFFLNRYSAKNPFHLTITTDY